MRALLLLTFLTGCDELTDTGSDGDLPGLESDDWIFATLYPDDGAGLRYTLTFGGIEDSGTLDAHFTELITVIDTGEVLCAASTFLTSDTPITDSGCDAAYVPDWEDIETYDSTLCDQVPGLNPAEADLSFYTGIGYQTAGSLCLQEGSYGWETIDGMSYQTVGESGFILQVSSDTTAR